MSTSVTHRWLCGQRRALPSATVKVIAPGFSCGTGPHITASARASEKRACAPWGLGHPRPLQWACGCGAWWAAPPGAGLPGTLIFMALYMELMKQFAPKITLVFIQESFIKFSFNLTDYQQKSHWLGGFFLATLPESHRQEYGGGTSVGPSGHRS